MTWNQLLATLGVSITDLVRLGFGGFIVILIGCIKPPSFKINLWGWVFQQIGKSINGEVIEKVNTLQNDVDSLRVEIKTNERFAEEEKIRNVRQRILRFNDEILLNRKHSKEHFDEILQDINIYETYCKQHKDYKNNKAVLAIDTIKKVYISCLEERDFLEYTPQEKVKSDDH